MQQQSWQIIAQAIKQAQATNSWKELGEQLSAARKEYAKMIADRGVELKEIKPSMLRRCFAHDYSKPGSYMITIVAADREAMPFGRVECTDSNLKNAHFVPSKVGEAMLECLKDIQKYYPMVEVHKAQLMPDHMHLILVVHAPIMSKNNVPTHIGNVIGGYKKGCNRAYWATFSMGEPSNTREASTREASTREMHTREASTTEMSTMEASTMEMSTMEASTMTGVCSFPEQKKHLPSNASSGRPPIWSKGYTDTIITGKQHMATEEAYLDDNPRRLAIKRKHRDLFRTIYHVKVGNYEYAAIGNVFLLRKAWKECVQFHHWEHLCPPGFQPCTKDWHCNRFYKVEADGNTRYYSAGEPLNTTSLNTTPLNTTPLNATPLNSNGVKPFPGASGVKPFLGTSGVKPFLGAKSEADAHTEQLLKAGDQGAVFASPFISEREKAVRNALLTMGCPYIRLTKEGFTDLYTPSKSEFYACAEGNLLILAPWGDRKRKEKITRAECKELNKQAYNLCRHDLDMLIIQADGFDNIIELKED